MLSYWTWVHNLKKHQRFCFCFGCHLGSYNSLAKVKWMYIFHISKTIFSFIISKCAWVYSQTVLSTFLGTLTATLTHVLAGTWRHTCCGTCWHSCLCDWTGTLAHVSTSLDLEESVQDFSPLDLLHFSTCPATGTFLQDCWGTFQHLTEEVEEASVVSRFFFVPLLFLAW